MGGSRTASALAPCPPCARPRPALIGARRARGAAIGRRPVWRGVRRACGGGGGAEAAGPGLRCVRRDDRGRVPESCRGGEAAEVAAHGPGDAGNLQPLQTGHGGRREHGAPWYAGLQRQSKVGCLECSERNVQRRCNESLHSKSGRTKGQIWHLRTD